MTDNRRYILNTLSVSLIIAGICTIPSIIVSVSSAETASVNALICVMIIFLSLGIFGHSFGGKTISDIRPRVMYMTVMLTWMSLILISSLAFYFGISGISPADAFMESAAAWTGTAASSIDCVRLSSGLALFRAVCNWLGGVGIVLICLSLMPSRRYAGYGLASLEFPGPDFLKDRSEFRGNYRRIFMVYAAFSVLQFVLLAAYGMPLYTALLSALSNSVTAGLHHINNSVIISLPLSLKLILGLFAFLGSMNSLIFIYVCSGQFEKIKNSSELKIRMLRILLSIAAVSIIIIISDPEQSVTEILTDSALQIVSFFSTSGFIAADMSVWPAACTSIILLQLFIGASSFSAGGGFKEARLLVALKSGSYTLYRHVHPNSVRTLTFDKKPIKSDRAVSANLFIALFMITYLLGALLLSLDKISIYDALTYSASMLTCTGTGIGAASASDLVAGFSSFSKIVMSFLMICGRLEIYPLLILFMRGFRKRGASL